MRGCTILLLAAAAAPVMGSHGLETIHSNVHSPLGTYYALVAQGQTSGPEIGNQVTVGGLGRALHSIEIRTRIGGAGVSPFSARLRLYANDGPGGEPGSLVWDSGDRPFIADSGADLAQTFGIGGGVPVPESFTWTVEIRNRTGPNLAPMGPAHYGPAQPGAAAPGWWRRDAGGWVRGPAAEAAFGVKFVACYANCDLSTASPTLNVADFTCFLQRFAQGHPYANCDQSSTAPVHNVADFTCFLERFASAPGCQ